ncbi:MAG TPA: GNAT family N-acetyltransferase [Solirubrobacterales bacterium]
MTPEAEPEALESIDGARLTVRPIAPHDAEALRAAFGHLSAETRYRRFLGPVKRLTEANVEYLTQLDHRNHEALVAVDDEGAIVGVARYIRLEDRAGVAEVAVTVADDWQGRGVGTALLSRLAARARAAGIEAFIGICLTDNEDMIQLLRELGSGAKVSNVGDGTVEVEAELPGTVTPAAARAALRAIS